ncbi:MAG: metal ABC transporter substrate-binding protein [Ancrocorticia sp.]|uniref:metal ABC transporter substrate-binding protein n=1 Tax=Ancrocorticia sp. TaxID=2593684 RepID=UPI003F9202EF
MKKLLAAISVASATLALSACSAVSDDTDASDGQLTVATSFYPLAWLVEQVGGENVNVISMTPSNVEPHDFELAPADIAKMNDADLVVYVQGFQPSMDDAVQSISGPEIVELSGAVDLAPLEDEHDHNDDDGHSHEEDNLDPHFWLDPARMESASGQIETALAAADTANSDSYEANQQSVAGDLTELDERFGAGLKTCERNTIVTTHAAFGYITDKNDIAQLSISGIDPEAEPSPSDIASISEAIEETGTTTVFAEQLASPKTAESLANETGAHLSVLNALESEPDDGDYITAMDGNLTELRAALDCQ